MEISGKRPDESMYKQEAKQAVELFEKGFKHMQTSKFEAQKEQFEKAMHKSLQVIHDAAKGLMNQEILKQKEQLALDFHDYLEDPTLSNQQKVMRDIDGLKESTG